MLDLKEKMILIAFCMTIMFCMSACSGNTINSGDNQNAVTEISTSENVETESSEENAIFGSNDVQFLFPLQNLKDEIRFELGTKVSSCTRHVQLS